MNADPIADAGRRFLRSPLLCERADRIARLAAWIGGIRELAERGCDRRAVAAAAWFHDAWAADPDSPLSPNPAAMVRP